MMEIDKDREERYKTWRHPMPEFPEDFYNNLYSKKNSFKKVYEDIIDLETRGKAYIVKKGQTVRIVQLEQAQVVDFCIWNSKDSGMTTHSAVKPFLLVNLAVFGVICLVLDHL